MENLTFHSKQAMLKEKKVTLETMKVKKKKHKVVGWEKVDSLAKYLENFPI